MIVVSTPNSSAGLKLTAAVAKGAALLEDDGAFAYQVMINRIAGDVPSLFPSSAYSPLA